MKVMFVAADHCPKKAGNSSSEDCSGMCTLFKLRKKASTYAISKQIGLKSSHGENPSKDDGLAHGVSEARWPELKFGLKSFVPNEKI